MNPYQSPSEIPEKPISNDWLAFVVILIILAIMFWIALPTIQEINGVIDPPQASGN